MISNLVRRGLPGLLAVTSMVLFVPVARACYTCSIDPATGCTSCMYSQTSGAEGCHVEGGGCEYIPPYCDPAMGCFLAGVLVATPCGQVPIETLSPGDAVTTWDARGRMRTGYVSRTHIAEALSYIEINAEIRVTGNHPFRVDGSWVEAGDITVGDVLTDALGKGIVVQSVARHHRGVRVYNITVGGMETFFAGGVYVHNKVYLGS